MTTTESNNKFLEDLKNSIIAKVYELNKDVKNLEIVMNTNQNINHPDAVSYSIVLSSDTFQVYLPGWSGHGSDMILRITNQLLKRINDITGNYENLKSSDKLILSDIKPLGYEYIDYSGKEIKEYNVQRYFLQKDFKLSELKEYQDNYGKHITLKLDNRTLHQSGNYVWFEYGVSKHFTIYFKTVKDAKAYITYIYDVARGFL